MSLKSPAMAALVLACALVAPAPAVADAPLPVHVTYSGTGTFHMNDSLSGTSEATDQLNWTIEFQSTLNTDGTFTSAQGTVGQGPGTFEFDQPDQQVSCTGSIPTTPPPPVPGVVPPPPAMAPPPTLAGITIQSITYLSDNSGDPAYASCHGTQTGLDYDATGIASDHVATLFNKYLPDVMSAYIAPIPMPVFLAQHAFAVVPVSSSQQVQPLPDSCADQYGEDSPSDCLMTLTWGGTMVVDGTAACPVIVEGPPLECMPSVLSLSGFEKGVSVNAPGAGTFDLTATAGAHASVAKRRKKHRAVVIATARSKVARAGAALLHPKLTRTGKAALKRSKRLNVTLRIVFTPHSGKTVVTTRALSLRR